MGSHGAQVLEALNEALYVTDADGRLQFCNAALARLTGYAAGTLLGHPSPDLYAPEDQPAILDRDDEGRPWYSVAVIQDITARKAPEAALRASEEHLQAALHEKEVLLKEIHHRVKNNPQVVAALLSLQSDQLKDPADVGLFEGPQHRVKSMALTHESLYSSSDLAHLNFASYVERLGTSLVQSSTAKGARLRLRAELEGLAFDVDTASAQPHSERTAHQRAEIRVPRRPGRRHHHCRAGRGRAGHPHSARHRHRVPRRPRLSPDRVPRAPARGDDDAYT
jgi:hypothetical protein